jgi:two-component sensor histidine kinase
VAAPFRQDAAFIAEALRPLAVGPVRTILAEGREDLETLKAGHCVLVASQEALTPAFVDTVSAFLETQPAWARLPVILLLDEGLSFDKTTAQLNERLKLSEVSVLYRPCYLLPFRSSVRNALTLLEQQRSVRDLLGVERGLRAEIDHRMKNQLATVLALYHLTRSQSSSFEGFDKAFSQRMGALSDVHDLLRRGSGTLILVEDLCQAILRPYSGETASRLRYAGPRLEVMSETALALSLMFNELTTNAVKYGALGRNDGTIEIDASRKSSEVVALSWRERGGPKTTAPLRKSYGTQFIETSARMLGGSARFDFEPAGLTVHIELAASKFGNLQGV